MRPVQCNSDGHHSIRHRIDNLFDNEAWPAAGPGAGVVVSTTHELTYREEGRIVEPELRLSVGTELADQSLSCRQHCLNCKVKVAAFRMITAAYYW